MPSYTYEGEADRYYPTLALTPEPGGSYTLDRNPGDGRWTPPDPEPTEDAPAETPARAAKSKTPPAPAADTTGGE